MRFASSFSRFLPSCHFFSGKTAKGWAAPDLDHLRFLCGALLYDILCECRIEPKARESLL